MGFPSGSGGKESARHAGDTALIPGSGRSHGEPNGYSHQCSWLENSLDRGVFTLGTAISLTVFKHLEIYPVFFPSYKC